MDRGLNSGGPQPPAFCPVRSQHSKGGECCWQPAKTLPTPGSSGPQRDHQVYVFPSPFCPHRRGGSLTPQPQGHTVRLCQPESLSPGNRCCGQEPVAQVQPMSHEGEVPLGGFRGETQTERNTFFSSAQYSQARILSWLQAPVLRALTPSCSHAGM